MKSTWTDNVPGFSGRTVRGLLHKEDFWDVLASSVHIYLDDVLEVDNRLIRLAKGPEIATDVLLCGTGWNKTSFDFFEPEEAVRLGLPHPLKYEQAGESIKWAQLEAKADEEIVAKFPILAEPPEHLHKDPRTTPYRLYKSIAPLHDNSIAFIGFAIVANYFRGRVSSNMGHCFSRWEGMPADSRVSRGRDRANNCVV